MSEQDREILEREVKRWLDALDSGDVQGLVDCCDDEMITANEYHETAFGAEYTRKKYAPMLQMFKTDSSWVTEKASIHNDIAVIIGHWDTQAKNKETGEVNGMIGRLLLVYRKDPESGKWKIWVDMDNNSKPLT